MNHIQIITQSLQIGRDMGANQHTGILMLFHILPKQIQQFIPCDHIQTGCRFIKNKHLRMMGKSNQCLQLGLHSG